LVPKKGRNPGLFQATYRVGGGKERRKTNKARKKETPRGAPQFGGGGGGEKNHQGQNLYGRAFFEKGNQQAASQTKYVTNQKWGAKKGGRTKGHGVGGREDKREGRASTKRGT